MRGILKAAAIVASFAGAIYATAVPQASATYAVTAHTVSGAIQDVNRKASTIRVNGLTLLVSSKTTFRGVSSLYDLIRGMRVTVHYLNHSGSKTAGSAIEIDVVQ
ncbi:MAG TPA: DUF5666 domain-containing protein [Gammaproteobacteria bacterium]|nr:DUF5666 domain-containing protein [Gammaproteobacteria bacterium]